MIRRITNQLAKREECQRTAIRESGSTAHAAADTYEYDSDADAATFGGDKR